MLKRTFDLVVAACSLIVTGPFWLIAAVLVKREDGGPILYGAVRIGKNGQPFRMYKFRSMVPNADRIGGTSTADDDPRLTRIGRRLRELKLDELPQLINVLRGDMSFVGPRPQVPDDVAKYTQAERMLLSVRPGITDYASIKFADEGAILRGHPDPDQAYIDLIRPEKIRLGLEYVGTQSFFVDMRILFLTATEVARRLLSRDTKAIG